MVKLPPFVNEIVVNITSLIGIEPSRIVNSIIISILIAASIGAMVVVFSMLRSLFRRNDQSDNIEAQTKAQAINVATAPSGTEYERMIHDAIETALLPINRRVKRLEEQTFSAADDSIQPTATAQLYDDVQDVVLPQADEVTSATKAQATSQPAFVEEEEEHTTIAQIQDTGIGQPAAPPAGEEVEHTTIAQIKDTGIEVAPSEQNTSIGQPAALPKDEDAGPNQGQDKKISAA